MSSTGTVIMVLFFLVWFLCAELHSKNEDIRKEKNNVKECKNYYRSLLGRIERDIKDIETEYKENEKYYLEKIKKMYEDKGESRRAFEIALKSPHFNIDKVESVFKRHEEFY